MDSSAPVPNASQTNVVQTNKPINILPTNKPTNTLPANILPTNNIPTNKPTNTLQTNTLQTIKPSCEKTSSEKTSNEKTSCEKTYKRKYDLVNANSEKIILKPSITDNKVHILDFIVGNNLLDYIKVYIEACAKNNIRVVKYLLDNNFINLETKEFSELTIFKGFDIACNRDNKECTDLIFSKLKNNFNHHFYFSNKTFEYLIEKENIENIIHIIQNNQSRSNNLTIPLIEKLFAKGIYDVINIINLHNTPSEIICYLLKLEHSTNRLVTIVNKICVHTNLTPELVDIISNKVKIVYLNLKHFCNSNFKLLIDSNKFDSASAKAVLDNLLDDKQVDAEKVKIILNRFSNLFKCSVTEIINSQIKLSKNMHLLATYKKFDK